MLGSSFTRALDGTVPPATRALLGTLLLASSFFLFFVSARDAAGDDGALQYPWIVVVPGKVMYYPWTLLVAGFAETSFLQMLLSLLSLTLAGRYLERVWGQAELLKFVAVVIGASNAIAVLVNYVESALLSRGKERFLENMSYSGMMGLQVGFLVAFTQLIPEHQVQIFGGLLKVRVKSLPMLYVTVSNVACLLGYQSPYILIQFGWFASWYYLRFVKISADAGGGEGGSFVRGDRSETFSLASWFPSFVQKYIRILSTFFFNISVRIGLLRQWTDIESSSAGATFSSSASSSMGGGNGHVLGSSSFGAMGSSNGGGARAEAERRRAMALKALDQRMASKPQSSQSREQSQSQSTPSTPGIPSAPTPPPPAVIAPPIFPSPISNGAPSIEESSSKDVTAI